MLFPVVKGLMHMKPFLHNDASESYESYEDVFLLGSYIPDWFAWKYSLSLSLDATVHICSRDVCLTRDLLFTFTEGTYVKLLVLVSPLLEAASIECLEKGLMLLPDKSRSKKEHLLSIFLKTFLWRLTHYYAIDMTMLSISL